jgi:hypothetical protein
MSNEPKAMREIHEIQEKIYDLEKQIPANERIANANQIAEDMIRKYEIRCKIPQKTDHEKTE